MPASILPIQQRKEVREHVIEVASNLFHQKGIRSVTMDDIAHALTMSKRTLYQLFADKEQLLLACVTQHEQETQLQVSNLLLSTKNVLEFLLTIFENKLKEMDDSTDSFFTDMYKYPKVIAHIKAHQKSQEDEAASFLEKGVLQGLFRADVNFHIVARQLVSSFDSVVNNGLINEYPQREIFINTILPYIRGCATIEGIKMIDTFLNK